MFVFVALSLWWLNAVHGLRGEYPVYYNQSQFSLSGSVGECTLSATYRSYGNLGSGNYIGCRRETSTWESQQEFDLQYFELVEVCPALEYLPAELQGPRQESAKDNLPEELVWRFCSTGTNCPRWSCEASNGTRTNLTYWQLLNATTGEGEYVPQFKVMSDLYLDSSQIPQHEHSCYRCDCQNWFTSNGEDQWAWNCYYYYGLSSPNDRCAAPTGSPTMAPTNTTAPTLATDSPTLATSVPTLSPTIGCTSNLQSEVTVGEYYWDSVNDCQTISYCYCEADGTESCKAGFENIYADPVLYPPFLETCGGYLADCWENTPESIGRLLQWYDFDISGNCQQFADWQVSSANDRYCPRCGCSHAELGGRNTTTYRYAVNDTQYFNCAECNCEYRWDGSFQNNVSVVQGCSSYDTENNNDAGDCQYEYTTCQSGNAVYDIASYDTCYTSKEHETACIFVEADVDGSSPDSICLEGLDYGQEFTTWDCDEEDVCSLLSDTRSGCFEGGFDVPLAAYDCLNNEWLLDDHDGSVRLACCDPLVDGNNCNNRTVEAYEEDVLGSCENSGFLADYYVNSRLCEYTQRNIYEVTSDEKLIRLMWCDDEIRYEDYAEDLAGNNTEKLCELLKVNWQYYTFCDCNHAKFMLRALEDRSDDLEDVGKRSSEVKAAFGHGSRALNLAWKWMEFECDEEPVVNQTVYDVIEAQFSCDFTDDPSGFRTESAARTRFGGPCTWLNMVALAALTLLHNRHSSSTMWMMLSLLAAVLYTCNAEFDWSYTGNNRLGECTFTGTTASDTSQVCEVLSWTEYEYQNEGVSWDVLVDACPELKYAGCYTEDQQIDQNDLLWGSETATCPGCPRCPCSNETDTVRYYVDERYDLDQPSTYIFRYCRRCDCVFDSDFDAWGWDCNWESTQSGLSNYPYILNDTDAFCIPEQGPPTPAPTPLSCMTNSGTGTTVDSAGPSGSTHCYWHNTTIDHYQDGEPSVCVLDEIALNLAIYGSNGNSHPICQVLAGDDSGCFYAEFDMKVQAYDCALDEWLTDSYRVESTVHCCNDAPYCNNQTTIDAVNVDDAEVRYQYNMTNYTYTCQRSSRLEEYLNIELGCEYRDKGVDSEYNKARKCRGGITKSKPDLCRQLENHWTWNTKCDCDRGLFFSKYLNETYDAYQNAQFVDDWDSTAWDLWNYNEVFECGFDSLEQGKWFCGGVVRSSIVFAVWLQLVLLALFSI